MAIFNCKKHLQSFYNLDNVVNTLFKKENPSDKMVFDRIDKVALSIAVKESLFQKLLSHNEKVVEARNKRRPYAPNLDLMRQTSSNGFKQVTLSSSGSSQSCLPQSDSKGKQTLRMLEAPLGLQPS